MKRTLDITLAMMALIFLAPLLLLVCLLIKTIQGGGILFFQERTGRFNQPFKIIKFRTMRDTRGVDGELLPDNQRITWLGAFLRSTSLDELPELINVLKGEMSLVGPRPLYPKYLPYYSSCEQLRHSVLPGITGWAQVNGRNYIPWDERLALDVWYVEHQSLWLDLRILFKTVLVVLARDGVAIDPDSVESDLDVERAERGVEQLLSGGETS